MIRNCSICKGEYDDGGDTWKKICYPCYKDYGKHAARIERVQHKIELYLTHPSVTKEELEEWIKKHGNPKGWGPEIWNPENFDKFKIWVNNINFD